MGDREWIIAPRFVPDDKSDHSMIRPLLTEIALFLTPFVLYALYLWATRAGVFDASSWDVRTVSWLTMVAFVFMIISFVFLAQFGGSPPGSTYVPAHMEDGRLVPGTTQ
jgi:hypothetical protein